MVAVAASYAAVPEIRSESDCAVVAPAAPTVASPAAELGADTARVDRMVIERRFAAC
jgi:DhnA family fructose-bisphosphate aldolase class Ia